MSGEERGLCVVDNGYRLCVLGDLSGSIVDRLRCAFEVPGENRNGRRVVDFYLKRGLFVGNTYLDHSSLNKYTRVTRGQDEMEVKNMI